MSPALRTFLDYLPYLSYVANAISVPVAIWKAHDTYQQYCSSKIRRLNFHIMSGNDDIQKTLSRFVGKTITINSALDFSTGTQISFDIASKTDMKEILSSPAPELNNIRIPIYKKREDGFLDSFVYLVVCVKDENILKFSHGGTGVNQISIEGKFKVEERHYSGPSIEFTLREVT